MKVISGKSQQRLLVFGCLLCTCCSVGTVFLLWKRNKYFQKLQDFAYLSHYACTNHYKGLDSARFFTFLKSYKFCNWLVSNNGKGEVMWHPLTVHFQGCNIYTWFHVILFPDYLRNMVSVNTAIHGQIRRCQWMAKSEW